MWVLIQIYKENLIERTVLNQFENKVLPHKVLLLLLGVRRVGKTKLIKKQLQKIPSEYYLHLKVENVEDGSLLKVRSVINYRRLLASTKLLVIDEGKNIPEIGLNLKLIVDSIEGIMVIATGSSVFDLSNKLG